MADSLTPSIDPDGGGVWTGVQDWPLIGIHATLTADNELLTFGTDAQGMQGAQVFYDVWDYETDTHYTLANTTGTDIFCSVSVLVPETGEILIIGGDARPLGSVNAGIKDVNVFDPEDRSLTPLSANETGLTYARWYATAVTLSNGKILVLGGIDENRNGQGTPELYTPGGGFKALDGAASSAIAGGWFYPRAWEASDGTVAIITNLGQGTMHRLDPSGDGSIEYYGDLPFSSQNNLPSVMYREDTIMVMSSAGELWTVDISGAAPVASMVADIGDPRFFSNMMVLPTGDVLIVGGGSGNGVNTLGTLYTEAVIYSPDTGTVTVGDAEAEGRLYHSTAILLPDASVLSLGGGAPGPFTNLNGEFYYPELLFDDTGAAADRIDITDAPDAIDQRASFEITVDDPSAVSRITMVKSGTVTHTLNMETRFIEADFTVDAATGVVTIDPGENSNVLTPGAWMVFVLDGDNVPSEAATVMVGLGGERYMPQLGTFVTLNGTAEIQAGDNEILLTPEEDNVTGSVHSNRRIDFDQDFTLTLSLYFGDKDAADGMAVVFHNDPYTSDAVGAAGGSLGVSGISNAFGIEFDTWNNNGTEISENHTGFITTNTGSLSEVGTHTAVAPLENDLWHDVVVTWDAATQTMNYTLDGVQIDSFTGDLASQHFAGDNAAFLAVTAATGGANNNQAVRITDFTGFFGDDAASIQGRYFVDDNGNDMEDPGEAGVAGATVSLYEASTLVDTTTTDANGDYSFDGVFAGLDMSVVFEDPNDILAGDTFDFVTADVGDDATDSDVVSQNGSGDGQTATFDIVRGANLTNVDAGVEEGPSGPIEFGGKTYVLLGSSSSWAEAQAMAVAAGGTLVGIDSQAENDFVMSTFWDDQAIFLDASDAASEGTFVTSAGDALGYSNWMPGEPNNSGGIQDYARIARDDGQWDDGWDGSVAHRTETGWQSDGTAMVIAEIGDEPPVISFGGKTYEVLGSADRWSDAQDMAAAAGGELLRVESQAESNFIMSVFWDDKAIFLDASDAVTEGTFANSDGQALTYSNWMPGEPNDLGGIQDFARIARDDGRWDDGWDGSIAHRAATGWESDGTALVIVQYTDEPNTFTFDGKVYEMIGVTDRWTNAQDMAAVAGGRLLEIDNQAENDFIMSTFWDDKAIFLDASDAALEGSFVNIDGEALGFTNWLPGEPNDFGGIQDYTRIATADGRWDDGWDGSVAHRTANGWENDGTAMVIIEYDIV